MNISELVGFIITILVLIYAIGRRMYEEQYRREHPEEYAQKKQEEEEAFKQFLRSLDIQVSEDSNPPTPPPPPSLPKPAKAPVPRAYVPPSTVAEGFEFKSKLEDFKQKSRVEERDFHSDIEDVSGRKLVSQRLKEKPVQQAYTYRARKGASQASRLVSELDDRRKLLLLHEIFGPPKADHWQDDPFSK